VGGGDSASLGIQLQAMIERDWRSSWKGSIWRETPRQLRLWLGAGNWLGVGDCGSWDDAVLDVCCTWC
jgi:hypothetical protein